MTKKRAQEHLDEIMDWFDFERVRKTMNALDWKWMDNPESPTVQELKQKVRELFWSCYDRKADFSSIGGFKVRIDYEEDFAECSFVVTSLETII